MLQVGDIGTGGNRDANVGVGIREGADGSKHLLAAPVGLRDLVETVPSPRLPIGLLRLEETVQVIESLGFLLGSGHLCPLAR